MDKYLDIIANLITLIRDKINLDKVVNMSKVKITIKESNCRCKYLKEGQTFIIEDLCPPICHELWNNIYPYVHTLLNGGTLDNKDSKSKSFDAFCPDEFRVKVHGEVIE